MIKRILVIAILALSPGYALAQTFTNQAIVDLDITGEDNGSGMGQGAEMKFSNDNIDWSDPEPFSLLKEAWPLTTGDGPKKVFMKLKDVSGKWSESKETGVVILDTEPPTGTIKFSAGSISFTIDITNEGP